jgi:hypothetical protein
MVIRGIGAWLRFFGPIATSVNTMGGPNKLDERLFDTEEANWKSLPHIFLKIEEKMFALRPEPAIAIFGLRVHRHF